MKCPGLFSFTCWVSLFLNFLPSLTVRLFYSICTQVPSVIPFHILFKAFSHSCLFCTPHHYNVDNSAEIPISVLLDSSRIQLLCYLRGICILFLLFLLLACPAAGSSIQRRYVVFTSEMRLSIRSSPVYITLSYSRAAAKSLQECPTLWDPHRRRPTRLLHPWDAPGKNTGVGGHFLLQCMKVKSESEVA